MSICTPNYFTLIVKRKWSVVLSRQIESFLFISLAETINSVDTVLLLILLSTWLWAQVKFFEFQNWPVSTWHTKLWKANVNPKTFFLNVTLVSKLKVEPVILFNNHRKCSSKDLKGSGAVFPPTHFWFNNFWNIPCLWIKSEKVLMYRLSIWLQGGTMICKCISMF